jgi:hypothetical protein
MYASASKSHLKLFRKAALSFVNHPEVKSECSPLRRDLCDQPGRINRSSFCRLPFFLPRWVFLCALVGIGHYRRGSSSTLLGASTVDFTSFHNTLSPRPKLRDMA